MRKIVTEGTTEENGDFCPGETSWGDPEQCDATPNGKAASIIFPDGVFKKYDYVITLDITSEPFQIGEQIKLITQSHAPDLLKMNGVTALDAEQKKIFVQAAREYTVLGYHKYATIAKLWV